MLLALLLVLATPEDPLDTESRAWNGELRIEAKGGGESQIETATFMLLTKPAKRRPTVPMQVRKVEARWSLKFDRKRAEGEGELITKGEGSGRFHISLSATMNRDTRRVRLEGSARPSRLVAKTVLSGIDGKGFAAHRTVSSRTAYFTRLAEVGVLSEDGRTVTGERTFEERGGQFPRTVKVTWKLTRLDPVVGGRVLDQAGAPVVGAEVIARTMGLNGVIAHTATTGKDGRFSIPAGFGTWGVEVKGARDGETVTSSLVKSDAITLKVDDVKPLELAVVRYRLASLPQSRLLVGKFRGDVTQYLAYIERRASARTLRAARSTN